MDVPSMILKENLFKMLCLLPFSCPENVVDTEH